MVMTTHLQLHLLFIIQNKFGSPSNCDEGRQSNEQIFRQFPSVREYIEHTSDGIEHFILLEDGPKDGLVEVSSS